MEDLPNNPEDESPEPQAVPDSMSKHAGGTDSPGFVVSRQTWSGRGFMPMFLLKVAKRRSLSFDAQAAFREMVGVSEGVLRIEEAYCLLECLRDRIQGSHQAAETWSKIEKVFRDWKSGKLLYPSEKRAFCLWALWEELGCDFDMHRDKLWRQFEKKHPELLDDLKDEVAVKNQTFRDALLDGLPKNKGGRPGH